MKSCLLQPGAVTEKLSGGQMHVPGAAFILDSLVSLCMALEAEMHGQTRTLTKSSPCLDNLPASSENCLYTSILHCSPHLVEWLA